MDTSKLKKFAQSARTTLLEQVTSKLALVLNPESAARREVPAMVNKLEEVHNELGEAALIDQVAYTWFNRFCALRFMDVNGYNRIGVLSPSEGEQQPEILAEAKAGVIDNTLVKEHRIREKVFGLLDGSIRSSNGQAEAYRLLIVSVCNAHYTVMPFLFERILDFTELLMPDDLLSNNSILKSICEVMTKDTCQNVEIIGWLYQFYISEKKDQVFAGLKKNQKIIAENIPAATQLFTPHWIVRYLVENSLGRLWLLNNPTSKLADQMDYYIAPAEPENDFLKISHPEELRICDPACGSGHMLTYAFDLLYAIYEEEGYDATEIPVLILNHNLYGIEIDDRARALAAFALVMKAAAKLGRRRFLRMGARPNICLLQNISFEEGELRDYMAEVGRDLFTADLRETLEQFEQAKNLGSLIAPKLCNPSEVVRAIKAKEFEGNLFLRKVHKRVLTVLRMAEALSPKYHVVVANPPYLGSKGMNGTLKVFAKENYQDSKSDLFAMFIERGFRLIPKFGYNAMVTMQSWMFLSSYEKLRAKLKDNASIDTMIHMGNMVMGIAFGTAATVWKFKGSADLKGTYCYVDYADLAENGELDLFPPQNERNLKASSTNGFYRVSAEDFGKIPGSPIAYWVSDIWRNLFVTNKALFPVCKPTQGLATGNNALFVRLWYESAMDRIGFNFANCRAAKESNFKWFPYNKGGNFRRWYGNQEFIIDWENDGEELYALTPKSVIRNPNTYFNESVSWSKISSGIPSFRYFSNGFIYDVAGTSIFTDDSDLRMRILAFCNSIVCKKILEILSPTLNFEVGHIASLPIKPDVGDETAITSIIKQSKIDWDAYETSWDFATLPLLSTDHRDETLERTYTALRTHWHSMTADLKRLEEENNRIFIDAYGLQDELTPEVPLSKISLTCNPVYRYRGKLRDEELESRLCADTLVELISYAVGCMFGRYSLNAEGLILADQGETLTDYLDRIPEPTFMPDDDNVIPLIDFEGNWFKDDISERFKQFLKVTFGEETFTENLAFIEESLGKNIHKYFVKDFYKDHRKHYNNRPIYWLFSSPKGTFNALIYMHRYRPDTASIVLNDYLREFRAKLLSRKDNYEQIGISASSSQKEKIKALKMIDKINKAIDEVNEYEREVLYPLAGRNIEIDLDDGVKHNYPLFGSALKKMPRLS